MLFSSITNIHTYMLRTEHLESLSYLIFYFFYLYLSGDVIPILSWISYQEINQLYRLSSISYQEINQLDRLSSISYQEINQLDRLSSISYQEINQLDFL
jgi:hypothetical protein